MASNTPMPFPPSMVGLTMTALTDRQMSSLDNNARFIVRQLVADAYARGFQDGRADYREATYIDNQMKPESKAGDPTP